MGWRREGEEEEEEEGGAKGEEPAMERTVWNQPPYFPLPAGRAFP